ncbi:unnamed protein product [Cylindrotheca closterium]|uniref:Uncharacterized protein n=1 Tax=Cylindrotheca closterium TaxID=2856 RepID=A0AAD2JMA8_9STRA|nr:unnamed protein product [Cylindrotheca closterium]
MQILKHSETAMGSNPSKSEDTLPTVNSGASFSDDYHSSIISAITIEDDFLSPRSFDNKLRSLVEKNRASDLGAEEVEQCLDALRPPTRSDRFSSSSDGGAGDNRPCAMPRRKSSSNNLNYHSFFLEDESPFEPISHDDGETKEDFEPSHYNSFTVSLNDEDDFNAAIRVGGKRRPRRKYRGRQRRIHRSQRNPVRATIASEQDTDEQRIHAVRSRTSSVVRRKDSHCRSLGNYSG